MEEQLTPEEQAIYDAQANDYSVELVEPEQVIDTIESHENSEQVFDEQPQKPYDYEAIEQERQARQKAEQSAEEARELAIEIAQQYAAMQEEIAQQYDKNVPTLEDDPKAHIAWLSHKVQEQQKLLNEFSVMREEQERINQEHYERQQLGAYFEEAKAQVQDKYPDLDNITNYLYEIADNSLKAQASLYPQWEDPALRQQQIGAELRQICQQCQKSGFNPIEVLVQKAKAFGYSGPQNKNEVEALQERNTAARTLAARGGQVPLGGVDIRTLSSMSEAELAAWVEKNQEKFEHIMDRM
ncbi:hypothetical protein [Bartonella sp. AR 15-3]|uniref:hypothetical protein n=1 Tax=Bartonella sp. AR 15-3 TaxID=545617 RepID=UPI0001F4C24C|nr:hypothetical protein [Bartonella sp. AR 15-3]OPB31560.1 hypothetical protein BAR153v2_005090 [Bartonella sp. AR 15-3]CBI79422.1 conserved hypothetical protein [Bartonella sp. AR 15-3]